ncbi:MAG: hypothetical protein HOJ15_03625 [Candidatus Jacksonbacteria bacterium]|nr:hypothetical protein [Candidatus Jacksonbacteria bacterium]MBT6955065.1 hypothetical protein [Candidatus Jacksonbacteria bacterium]
MTDEQWQGLLDKVEESFEVIDSGVEDVKDDNMPFGSVDWIEFSGDMGRIRLEYSVTPRVLDKKVLHSHRGGSEVVQKVYSETEKVSDLKAYKWNDTSEIWEDIQADNLL